MINYSIIADSIQYYEIQGFKRIESPWTVSQYVENITKPFHSISNKLVHNDKCLVASGEQSFLYLYLKEFLPLGQYSTTTPCFRNEEFDYLHSKYFIKNELIKTDVVTSDKLDEIVEICLKFYRKYIPHAEIAPTESGYDIIYDNIELGSYGIRACEFLKWIYATGCAEPRLSKAISKYNIKYGK